MTFLGASKPGLAYTLRQWRALFLIYVQDGLAYRAQGFIWILADAATAIVLPLVWLAAGNGQEIQGFTPRDFITYYLGMLFLSSFVICHFMWDISTEIREGIFSSQLVRPISFFQFTVVRNFAWRCIRTLIFAPLLGLLLLSYSGQLAGASVYLGWEFWVSLLLGHLVSVAFVTAMAMLALIVQEAQSIFELYYVPQMFLSGQLFPVKFLPEWAQYAAQWTPFYYTVGAPTEILVGRTPPDKAVGIILIQLAWFGGSIILYKFMFRVGMKHYTGVGM